MDAAAKTSEDTAKMSLHIKGTPTASQGLYGANR